MPTTKSCPKCGTKCILENFVSGIVFGYKCKNCGYEFDVWKIVVGWNDEADNG